MSRFMDDKVAAMRASLVALQTVQTVQTVQTSEMVMPDLQHLLLKTARAAGGHLEAVTKRSVAPSAVLFRFLILRCIVLVLPLLLMRFPL
jgi:hypothetical protein